jgi:phosphate transport system permease protein
MSEPQAIEAKSRIRPFWRGRNIGDYAFTAGTLIFGLVIIGIAGGLVLEMARTSWPAILTFGWQFLVTSVWNPVTERFGALPLIWGTLVSSLLALVIATPISLGAAVFLSEMAPPWIRSPLSFMVELLAAIPSVVYGLWGIFVLAPILRTMVEPALRASLGFLPLFSGPTYGIGMLAGGLILAIMIIPTITAISREVLLAVPNNQREAMFALGGTRWEAVSRAVVPYARVGIIGAVILGLGRALGETMAITMVIGNRSDISFSLFAPANTMARVIANEFAEATSDLYVGALVEIGLILFGVTLLLNVIARLLVWRVAGSTPGVAQQ